ncbi:phage replisome organizer N-terminal domain-containing protein [Clostridium taeniosporum]|uniref:Replisome organizer n=1 Tax=Clostridium taeniosporum TaxID=394958 RepID=A0A1D7XK93_9CLOT|nr:phage replisome organizer N-terminal domain-containing protein [Clostridium taeniosporum]AOR23742.1 replisome organizer [Clostridium taeniosporum]
MRERKFVKIRVDMYSDTKFKIIDTMEERDIIHYIWTRLLTLAGKVNLAGELYMSKSIPYKAETLAIEFNRSTEKVKMALDVFKNLEMIELTKDNVYKVKNFTKHQNIKVKEEIKKVEKSDDKENLKDNTGFKNNELNNICEKTEISNNLKTQKGKSQGNTNIENISEQKYNDSIYYDICNKNKENEPKYQDYKARELKNISEKQLYNNNDDLVNKKFNIESYTETSDICKNNIEKNFKEHNKVNVNNKIEANADNDDSIINIKDKESKNRTLSNQNSIVDEKFRYINSNINLLNIKAKNKKKCKKPKKKCEDIEELFFEEDEEDIVVPIECSDEPNIQGKLVRSFNF